MQKENQWILRGLTFNDGTPIKILEPHDSVWIETGLSIKDAETVQYEPLIEHTGVVLRVVDGLVCIFLVNLSNEPLTIAPTQPFISIIS